MNRNVARELKRREQEYQKLEQRLQAALQPVHPKPDYIEGLRQKIELQWATEDAPENGLELSPMLIAASLLSGTFLIVLAVRGILALFGRLQHYQGAVEQEQVAPASQAV